MRRLGRQEEALSLEQWYSVNYHPGLRHYLEEDLKLTQEELDLCYRIWREYTTTTTPPFFPGVLPFLARYRAAGGLIAVVSHSEPDIILRHYREQSEAPGLEPDEIIGWTGDREKNKPSVWPVRNVAERTGIAPRNMVVVDDLKPGILMARSAGVDSIGVGWSHRVPELREDIRQLATFYAETVEELERIVWGGNGSALQDSAGNM